MNLLRRYGRKYTNEVFVLKIMELEYNQASTFNH